MGRAPCCDKTKVKRGPWSPDEDSTLKNYVQIHGTGGNWIALPQKAGLRRCGKSCRLRWLNYLRPDIKHGGFTNEEDDMILALYHTIGSRWSVIASHLPGRTDNDVKNHWNTKLKKKLATHGSTTTVAASNSTVFPVNMNFSLTGTPPPPAALANSSYSENWNFFHVNADYYDSVLDDNHLQTLRVEDYEFPLPRIVEETENPSYNNYYGFPGQDVSGQISPSFFDAIHANSSGSIYMGF